MGIDSTDRKMLVLKTVKMHGCQFCGKEFNNKSNYNRHVRQMHLNFEIKCDSCGTTSPSLNQSEIHKVFCGRLKCACGKSYDTKLGFKRHCLECKVGGKEGLQKLEIINSEIAQVTENARKNQKYQKLNSDHQNTSSDNSENLMKTLTRVIEQQLMPETANQQQKEDGDKDNQETFNFTKDELFFRPGKGWYKLVKLTRNELNYTVQQGWTELEKSIDKPVTPEI